MWYKTHSQKLPELQNNLLEVQTTDLLFLCPSPTQDIFLKAVAGFLWTFQSFESPLEPAKHSWRNYLWKMDTVDSEHQFGGVFVGGLQTFPPFCEFGSPVCFRPFSRSTNQNPSATASFHRKNLRCFGCRKRGDDPHILFSGLSPFPLNKQTALNVARCTASSIPGADGVIGAASFGICAQSRCH